MTRGSALIVGISLVIGLLGLGALISRTAIEVKEYERTVTVKGLSEQEQAANIIIWPIRFTVPGNELPSLYVQIDATTAQISDFLQSRGLAADAISATTPTIIDKSAQAYGDTRQQAFRYTATQTVTVYSEDVETVRTLLGSLSELGKSGIAFTGNEYETAPQYLFTGLNDIKPAMVEEATRKAREVAEKFAEDSDSRLGKIKRASQGQFSISPRDQNNPHIKTVRVVSTVEYYLSD